MRCLMGKAAVVLAAGSLLVAACSPSAPQAAQSAPAPLTAAQPAVGAFTVNFVFSTAAAAKLKGMEEKVIFNAWYYAAPKPGVKIEGGDAGVPLGETTRALLPENQTITLTPEFDAVQAAEQTEGGVRMLVNVYSARLADADNLLDCTLIDEPVADLPTRDNAIACKLIGEP
jgi:hypothetical protein